jgi:cell division protein ZapA
MDLNISVLIAGRQYRMKVKAEDEEEKVRAAAKEINDKVDQFAKNYAFKDKQDLLAMVALLNKVEVLGAGSISQEKEQKIAEKLEQIDQILTQNDI